MTVRMLAHDWFPQSLPDGVTMAVGAWLYSTFSCLHLDANARVEVGADSGVYDGCHFDLGPRASVTIGRWASIVGAIFATNGPVRIGDHVFVAHQVVLADDAIARPGGAVTDDPSPAIELGDNVWIASEATVLAPCRIGDNTIVGARTVVTGDVPANSLVTGNPPSIRPVPAERRSDAHV